MLNAPWRVVAALALVTAIGCGDDDGSGPEGTISISASPTTLSVQQGASGSVTVALTRGGGFSSPVNVTVEGLPSGVTATVTPTQLTGTTTSATVTVNVASTVATGTYPATVRATATGVGPATATYTLTVAAAPAGSFTISAAPAAVNIAAGATGTSTVTIVRTNLTSDVALSLVTPPTGITGTFTPATLSGTTLTSNLALSVAATVAPGTYPITVRGTAGTITQNATVTVTVAAGSTVSLSTTPTTLTIQQGSSSAATLNATRTNFTGNIIPSVTGNPAGMTVSFNPTPLTANTSTITVNVGAGVATGQYTLTITGAAGAAGNPTTTLQVTVTAPSGSNIVWEFCNVDAVPIKFWRLSAGTWSEVAPTVVGNATRFSFSVSGTQAGVAFTRSVTEARVRASTRTTSPQRETLRSFSGVPGTGVRQARARLTGQGANLTSPYYDTFVLFALASELASYGETCETSPALVSKSFTVSGQGAGETGLLGYGGVDDRLLPQTTSYNLMVEAGTYDWMALFGPTPTSPSLANNWTHYRLGRAEPAPGSTVAINRTGATSLTPVAFTVTGGAAGSFYQFHQFLDGSRGSIVDFSIGEPTSPTGAGTMQFLAPGDRLTTDMNELVVVNTHLASNTVSVRLTFQYFGSAPPATTSFALPQAVPIFTVAAVTGAPVPTWTVTGLIPTDYQTATGEVWASFQGAGESTLYTIRATRGWLTANNMSTTYTLTAPTLPGFLTQWAPAAPLVEAQVQMFGSNFATTPVAGAVLNWALLLVQSP